MKNLRIYLCAALVACVAQAHAGPKSRALEVPYSPDFLKNVELATATEPVFMKITDQIYQALGYGLANCLFIIGDTGVTVIDTLYRVENAERVLAALREITDKPITSVLYSHGHPDHTGGVRAFVPEGKEREIDIYAADVWERYRKEVASPLWKMLNRRAFQQFGIVVAQMSGEPVKHAIGLPTPGTTTYIEPTHKLSGRGTLTLQGMEIEYVHIPSELDDELILYFPKENIAFASDVVGHVYPFLATPRHEPARSPKGIIEAERILMGWNADVLLLGHGKPVFGKENVREFLLIQHDADQTIYDQTIAAINANKTRDQAAAEVKLPPHLLNNPELIDSYHAADWVTKGLYTILNGWFDNDQLEMVRHFPVDEANRMIKAMGGVDQMIAQARSALEEGDYPWAAQLATYLLRAEQKVEAAKHVRIEAFRAIAAKTHTSNMRYFLLSNIVELELGYMPTPPFDPGQCQKVPTLEFLNFLGPRLDIPRSLDTMLKVNIRVSDTGEDFRLHVRRGVLERRKGIHRNADLTLVMDRSSLIDFAGERAKFKDLIDQGKIKSSGGDPLAFGNLFN